MVGLNQRFNQRFHILSSLSINSDNSIYEELGCSFPEELLEKMDDHRGLVPRSVFLQELVKKELAKQQ